MNYKNKFLNGAKWNTIKMLITTVIQFMTILIVGKFISPEEYGLYGMVNVFIGIANIFTDAGFSDVIIYKQENDDNIISSLYWTNIIIGIIIFIIIVLLSPLAAAYYKEKRLINLIILSGINFLILPFGQIFISLAKKDLKFRDIAIIDSISSILQIIFVLIFAINKFGILSLIYGGLFQSFFSSILYVIINKDIKIKFHIRYNEIKEFIKYGSYQLGSKLTNYLRGNVDYLLIGRFLGANALGIYTLAYQLIMFPIQKINPILTDTSYPIFIKFKNDNEKLNGNYYKLQKIISYLVFPIIAGIFVVIPEFIKIFYGAGWQQSIAVIRIYCITSVIISLGNPIGCILYPKGRFDIAFIWNILSAIFTFIFDLIGIKWGIRGVAVASTIYAIFIMWPVDFYIRKLVSNMKVKDYFINLKDPAFITFFMVIILFVIKFIIKFFIISNSGILIILVAFGALIYIELFKFYEKDLYNTLKSELYLKVIKSKK